MTLNELIPELQALPRADELLLIQMMAADVAREDAPAIAKTGETYPILSPYDAHEGALALQEFLKQDEAS